MMFYWFTCSFLRSIYRNTIARLPKNNSKNKNIKNRKWWRQKNESRINNLMQFLFYSKPLQFNFMIIIYSKLFKVNFLILFYSIQGQLRYSCFERLALFFKNKIYSFAMWQTCYGVTVYQRMNLKLLR